MKMEDEVLLDLSKEITNVQIHVEGLKKIDDKLIFNEMANLKKVKNVKELFSELMNLNDKFNSFDLFQRTITKLHCPKGQGDVSVTYKFEEKKLNYSVSTNINHNGQTSLDFEAMLPALFGNLNTLSLSTSVLGKSSFEFAAQILIPRFPILQNYRGCLSFFKSNIDMTSYASYTTSYGGCSLRLTDNMDRNALLWEIALRDLVPSLSKSRIASSSLMRMPNRSLKNSLKYVYTNDKLQGVSFPTGGELTQAAVELCLPGGNARFLKSEFHKLFAASITDKLILHCSMSIGGLLPLRKEDACILDKFYLGGIFGAHTVLRGFASNGIGPTDRYVQSKGTNFSFDYLGGNSYINSQILLSYAPKVVNVNIPFSSRIFAFANAGNLIDSLYGNVIHKLSRFKMAIGLGILVPFPVGGWLEVLFAMPFLSQASDHVKKFQAGIHLRSCQL